MPAAITLWIAENTIFSAATAHTGSGHITRSSISRVTPNSCASGSATAAMPANMMPTAINPGNSTVEKVAPFITPRAIGFIAAPPAMCGITKVKTKRNSSGFMPTRMANGSSSRRNT